MNSQTILTLSTTDWDAPQFGSRQQIALQLARRGHRVLFVEVPRALHSLISAPLATCRALRRMGRFRPLADRLMAYTPPPVLPIYYHPLTNALNQRLLLRYLRTALARLGWQPDVLWTYWPHTAYLVGRLGERIAVYHCIDDFTAVRYPLVAPDTIPRMEAKLCHQVDLVLARTEGLVADKRRYNRRTFLLTGGVDTALFDPARAHLLPAEVTSLPLPRVGLVGTLDDRLDVDLLAYCATHLPGVVFLLVGPTKGHLVNLGPLRACPNVHLPGPCPHSHVPGYVAVLDVALIPYAVTPATREVSPLKLYEYLAMGKPVVATNLPYLRREVAHIRIAPTPEEFLAGVREALACPPTAEEQARWRAVAEAHSWDRQVDEIEYHLALLLDAER